MSSNARVAVVEDPRYRNHRAPAGHPERPERLVSVAEAIAERASELGRIAARRAETSELLRVHPLAHLRAIGEAVGRAPTHLDADTYLSPESLEVAELAAGASIDLVRAVARGDVASGIAAVRPPGHHAETDRAMGFCLFNNVALAARAARAEEGVERILILDWDVHHGNGTQHFFEDDPDVLFLSTHQFPFYPGTGRIEEAGIGRGEGATVNVALPAGCGDTEYLGVLQRVLVPVAQAFRPELVIVSCGFDAHASDPLAQMQLSADGFLGMARIARAVAESCCHGRLALVLEGGYAHQGLLEGTRAVLAALLDPSVTPPSVADPAPGGVVDAVVGRLASVHGPRFPGLGAA